LEEELKKSPTELNEKKRKNLGDDLFAKFQHPKIIKTSKIILKSEGEKAEEVSENATRKRKSYSKKSTLPFKFKLVDD